MNSIVSKPKTEQLRLQVVPRKRIMLGTSILDALRVHGRTIGSVMRCERIGLNEAVAMLLRDVREEHEKVWATAYREGIREQMRRMMATKEAA